MKTALVLSGGGAKGSWQAGVIKRLYEIGNSYDAFFGVSVGALNAAFLSQYTKNESSEAIADLTKQWLTISNKDIKKHHSWLKWLLVPWKYSVYDTTPLKKRIKNSLNIEKVRKSGNILGIGVTNLSTGLYEIFREDYHDLHNAVYSSAAFPVMFDLGMSCNDYMSDGGLVHITPLKAAIEWGADKIDVITLDSPGISRWEPPKKSWWEPKIQEPIIRMVDVVFDNIIERDLKECIKINKRVKEGRSDNGHRFIDLNIIRPKTGIPVSSLDFDPPSLKNSFELGYKHAINFVG